MKLLFRWAEMTRWEVYYDADGDPCGWVFQLRDRKLRVLHHAVAVPGPVDFETDIAAASGRQPKRKSEASGKV